MFHANRTQLWWGPSFFEREPVHAQHHRKAAVSEPRGCQGCHLRWPWHAFAVPQASAWTFGPWSRDCERPSLLCKLEVRSVAWLLFAPASHQHHLCEQWSDLGNSRNLSLVIVLAGVFLVSSGFWVLVWICLACLDVFGRKEILFISIPLGCDFL